MVQWTMKVELKFASTESGEPFVPDVTVATIVITIIGTSVMQKLSVVSWDTKNLVSLSILAVLPLVLELILYS